MNNKMSPQALIAIMALGIAALGFFLINAEPEKPRVDAPAKVATDSVAKIEKVLAWRPSVGRFKDGLTNRTTGYYVQGPRAWPETMMEFPYSDVSAQIIANCRMGESPKIQVRFTTSPNLSNDKTESGYSVSSNRVSFDGRNPIWATFTQNWGGETLFSSDKRLVRGIASGKTMRIELKWYGEGSVIFPFDLSGSSKALANLSESCIPAPKASAKSSSDARRKVADDAKRNAEIAKNRQDSTAAANLRKTVEAKAKQDSVRKAMLLRISKSEHPPSSAKPQRVSAKPQQKSEYAKWIDSTLEKIATCVNPPPVIKNWKTFMLRRKASNGTTVRRSTADLIEEKASFERIWAENHQQCGN